MDAIVLAPPDELTSTRHRVQTGRAASSTGAVSKMRRPSMDRRPSIWAKVQEVAGRRTSKEAMGGGDGSVSVLKAAVGGGGEVGVLRNLHPWNHAPRQLTSSMFDQLRVSYLHAISTQHEGIIDVTSFGPVRGALRVEVWEGWAKEGDAFRVQGVPASMADRMRERDEGFGL